MRKSVRIPFRPSLFALLCAASSALAQNSAAGPTIDAPSAVVAPLASTTITVTGNPNDVPKAIIHEEAEREVRLEETQRIAAVVPNFNTVISGEGVPLNAAEKFKLAWRATEDPFNVVGAFVLGGLSELQGTNRGFGWGPQGYFKRSGANLADVADGTMLAGAVYPVLLHQDPRYFRKGTGSFGSRLGHAIVAPYLCRGDNGRTEINASNILGNLTAGAISNAYYPSNETGFGLTLRNSSIVTVEGSLGTIAMEFAPDVQNYLRNRRNRSFKASSH